MLTGDPGELKMIGRNELDVTGCMEANLSSDAFHMIIVPPVAFDFLKAMSWSNLSLLFNSQKY